MVFPEIQSCSLTSLDKPLGFQEGEAPRIPRKSTHEGGKVFSLGHRPTLKACKGDIPCAYFSYRLNRSHGHNVAGRIN